MGVTHGGGKPYKLIDIEVAKRAASLMCTNNEIATICGIAHSTFYEHLKNQPELAEALEEGRDRARVSLRRVQYEAAMSGNTTMQIWLGKQWLGQKDRHELAGDPDRPLSYVVRVPAPIEDDLEWLRTYGPREIEAEIIDG